MYLSKLEILGFKSFSQKTIVNFNEGVTSIVGPNGCGKTNIVDSIRWCLGEQRSSALRSDKMENVIFNGTSNKKPMGMAEVSLTIQNTKGILPTEYSEVLITRRIFRSLLSAVKASSGYLEGLEFSEILGPLSLLIAYDVIFISVAFMVFDSVVEE